MSGRIAILGSGAVGDLLGGIGVDLADRVGQPQLRDLADRGWAPALFVVARLDDAEYPAAPAEREDGVRQPPRQARLVA